MFKGLLKISDYLLAKILGKDIFNRDYETEYLYTYKIDLDKDVKTVCKIYDFEKIKEEKVNGDIKRNIR